MITCAYAGIDGFVIAFFAKEALNCWPPIAKLLFFKKKKKKNFIEFKKFRKKIEH